jgi:integrase/recombinase XerD
MPSHDHCQTLDVHYIRDVGRFAAFIGRSPDTATAEDLRRFQVEQRELAFPCRR